MDKLKAATLKLFDYCKRNNWEGYDPFDALNSKWLEYMPFMTARIPRLAITQLLKRSPINIRPLMAIQKTQNPKALALFLKAFIKLFKAGLLNDGQLIDEMVTRLNAFRWRGVSYYCWGYSFPWQTRELLVDRDAPNLICTVFVADALLDVYELVNSHKCLDMAKSAAEYVLNELYWIEGDHSAGFRYPDPSLRVHYYNADLLGAALLCRVYHHTREERFLAPALRVAQYAASRQQNDGSWFYGESRTSRWIDNFHTGYNLLALRDIEYYAGTSEFLTIVRRGFDFYRANFFRDDGAPKYFHNRVYPIDIHSVAQSVITLVAFKKLNETNLTLSNKVLQWAFSHMWDDQGYFYYQAQPLFINKISYMRWSQAWMLLALAVVIEDVSL